jgi:lysophospholipase L1-like esterase
MKILLYAVMFISSATSCTKKNNGTYTGNMNTIDSTGSARDSVVLPGRDTLTHTYLALGDSYTIGESVGENDRFPVQAQHALQAKGVAMSNPDFIAVTGWTTTNLLSALDNNPPANNYDAVTLLIGVNNQYQGGPLDEYKAQFTELLSRSIKYAGNNINHVFVISIPDYSVTPFARNRDTATIAAEIDAFNAANRSISIAAGVHYIDITPISRQAKNDASLLSADSLHPSGMQYQKWVELLAPAMQQALQ